MELLMVLVLHAFIYDFPALLTPVSIPGALNLMKTDFRGFNILFAI
jgi:hypothetical protein